MASCPTGRATLVRSLRPLVLCLPRSAYGRVLLMSACSSGTSGGDIEDAPPSFCIPADGVHIPNCRWDAARRCCSASECPALFTPPDLRVRQRQWRVEPQPPLLIVAAGPERSGSTWLYNAVRLLFEHAEQPLDAYFIGDITDAALDARGAGRPGSHHVLVKAHRWSDSWDLSRATHIFVTHRDLREVVASYRRLGWGSWLPRGYVADHMRWRDRAELDLFFEHITQQPVAALQQLAGRLLLEARVDCQALLAALEALPVPTSWMDPVTQIWPNHLSGAFLEARRAAVAGSSNSSGKGSGGLTLKEGQQHRQQEVTAAAAGPARGGRGSGRGRLSQAEEARLLQQEAEYFKLYGYR